MAERAPIPVTAAAADGSAAEVRRIAALMGRFSLEATRLEERDVATLRQAVPERTPVYLTAVPGRPLADVIEPARRVRATGLEPVPHLAARSITAGAELDDLLSRLTAVAGVRCVLAIAGDRDRPAGPFASA